jgi:hypothetical protein
VRLIRDVAIDRLPEVSETDRTALGRLGKSYLRISRIVTLCGIGAVGPCIECLVAFGIVLGLCASEPASAADFDFSKYAHAVEFCRGDVPRPMALSENRDVLCFDGEIWPGQDYVAASALEEGGLFVVRSTGGEGWIASKLAEFLADRRAVVVVYDYCLSACASYLLLASTEAFVLRNSLVAWHDTSSPYYCPFLGEPRDGGLKRLQKSPCPDAPAEVQRAEIILRQMDDRFYRSRILKPDFEMPPESVIVRRRLRSIFGETALYPGNLLWTWNPRYYAMTIKTKVTYEKYPESQDEVDAMGAKLSPCHVIYDP